MRIGLRFYSADTIAWLKNAIEDDGCTRSALARELCEREDWRNSRGELCLSSARAVLPKLASTLDLTMPAAQPMDGAVSASRAASRDYPDRVLTCALDDLGAVSVVPVRGGADRRLARSMMATHHPEGDAACPGGRIRYWIISSSQGALGGLVFSAASWHQKARDGYIGWSQAARAANIGRVLNNDRFLILPSVKIHGVSSLSLSLACVRLADDWEGRYGDRPVLLYTYVGPEHTGASYLAAGWQRCTNPTSGMPPGRGEPGPRRSVWMKPLAADWQADLRREPSRVMGAAPGFEEPPTEWAEREYGRSSHGDYRLRARLVAIGRTWAKHPGAPLRAIFPGVAERKAVYRFLSNPHTTVEHILEPHQEALVERCREQSLVLAVQDTTLLNCGGRKAMSGLVDIGDGDGIAAHFGIAFSLGEGALGVFHLDADFRLTTEDKEARNAGKSLAAEKFKESRRWLAGLDKALELSAACPGTRVVTICDREGDQWDLMNKACAAGACALVRASRSTRRRVFDEVGDKQELWAYTAGLPCIANKTIAIEAKGGHGAQTKRAGVRLEVRAAPVDLVPPKDRPRGTSPLRMLAVRVLEPDPPAGINPLDWLLLSTEGEATPDNALQIVSWYESRWLIKEYFKALKAGTRIGDRWLKPADALRKCLTFDAVNACKVMPFEHLARSEPDASVQTGRSRI